MMIDKYEAKMKIWLDDVRPMPEGYDYWAKNAYQAYGAIISGSVTHISFDHDLGRLYGEDTDDSNNTGYAVACFIERWVISHAQGIEPLELSPITWEVHSANPVGRKDIEMAMRSAERFWNQ